MYPTNQKCFQALLNLVVIGVGVYVGLILVEHVEVDGDGAEEGQADDHCVARPAARVPRLQVAVPAEPGVVVVVGLQIQCKY